MGKAPALQVIPIIPALLRNVSSDFVPYSVYGRGPYHSHIKAAAPSTRAPSPAESTGPDGG